jgi:hypothetical protein
LTKCSDVVHFIKNRFLFLKKIKKKIFGKKILEINL